LKIKKLRKKRLKKIDQIGRLKYVVFYTLDLRDWVWGANQFINEYKSSVTLKVSKTNVNLNTDKPS
jgi:hypothetical protein